MAEDIAPLRDFVIAATCVADATPDGPARIDAMRPLLARLVARDDWLPAASALSHPDHYMQHLLHCDPLERFCVVSFVWGPGHRTPVHDHTVWGLIGMLRGAEVSRPYRRDADGTPREDGPISRLEPGDVELVSPATSDIHQVTNAYDDRESISVHVYGANIGSVSRHVFDLAHRTVGPFVSGYSPAPVPNLWDRSGEVRAAWRQGSAS